MGIESSQRYEIMVRGIGNVKDWLRPIPVSKGKSFFPDRPASRSEGEGGFSVEI
jgi:hypothetical protein